MSPPEAVEATVNDQEDYLAKKYAYNDGLDVSFQQSKASSKRS